MRSGHGLWQLLAMGEGRTGNRSIELYDTNPTISSTRVRVGAARSAAWLRINLGVVSLSCGLRDTASQVDRLGDDPNADCLDSDQISNGLYPPAVTLPKSRISANCP